MDVAICQRLSHRADLGKRWVCLALTLNFLLCFMGQSQSSWPDKVVKRWFSACPKVYLLHSNHFCFLFLTAISVFVSLVICILALNAKKQQIARKKIHRSLRELNDCTSANGGITPPYLTNWPKETELIWHSAWLYTVDLLHWFAS